MNGSKPYGPSGDPQTSGEAPTRFAMRASPFPSNFASPPPEQEVSQTMNKRSLRSAHASKRPAHQAKKALTSRRDFLHRLTAGVCAAAYLSDRTATGNAQPPSGGIAGTAVRFTKTESDVGSLFPFIQSQAVKSDFPLSFLNPKFKSYQGWKRKGRGKLLELLHYAPPPC